MDESKHQTADDMPWKILEALLIKRFKFKWLNKCQLYRYISYSDIWDDIWSQHQPLRPLLLHLLSPLRFVLRQSPRRNSKVSWSGPQKKTAMNIIPGLPLLQLQRDWGCCIFFCGLFHCRPQNLDGHKDLDAGVDNLSPQVKGFTSTPNWTVAGTWQHGKQCSLDVDIEKQIFDSKPKSRLCFHFNPITESDRRKLSRIKQWKEWKWSKSQAVAWIFAESSGRALIFKRILAKHRANENEY